MRIDQRPFGSGTDETESDIVPVVLVTARNPVVDDSPTSQGPPDSSTPAEATTPTDASTTPGATTPTSAATTTTSGPGGFGLRGMRERCEALGGGAHGRLVDELTFETTAWIPLAPSTAVDLASPDESAAQAGAER
ncbi:ATP-binding protein [Brevibacterium metallidurans]|uniref:Uncharacterized protein n=1 Tax=Brevibacterium metallidurans TaxID=1482676 RepID=A0ABP3C9Z4_9MICO